jgi:predicted MPP superfamily phosphohydrolase
LYDFICSLYQPLVILVLKKRIGGAALKSNTPISRRTFLNKGVLWFGGLMAFPTAGYGYSRLLEPRWIQVTNHTLSFRRLPPSFNGKRIVHFSDIHLDYHFGIARLKELTSRILELKPDLLCFTGDLYHASVRPSESACIELLSSLEAPLGKWAVLGNHDYTAGAQDVEGVLTKGGFTVLNNRSVSLEYGGQRIRIAGIDDALQGRPNLDLALKEEQPNFFTLFLSHEPDLADYALAYSVDLQLSGHSHGGQVNLPIIGPLILPEMAYKYPQGLYLLEDRMYLYTNKGIGVSTYPVRFMCRPEITVITISTMG